jgi:subtilisin family serine protease
MGNRKSKEAGGIAVGISLWRALWWAAALVMMALLPALAGTAKPTQAPADESLAAKQRPLFEKLHVLEAWQLTKGSPDVLVGVIDTGFDYFHPDLAGQLIPGYYAPGGYHTEIAENVGHGTLVASIIAAKGEEGVGMTGLSPGCRILTASLGVIEHKLLRLELDFMKTHSDAKLADLQSEMAAHGKEMEAWGKAWTTYQAISTAEAIRYLVDHHVRVINDSGYFQKGLIASPDAWRELDDAFKYAASKDVLIVLSAGNSAQETNDYPGDESHTIVAGASMLNDQRWEEESNLMGTMVKQGSNYGRRLTVMAPTESILVCVPHEQRFYAADNSPMGPRQGTFEGMHEFERQGATSAAAPIVTSLVALVYSLRPELRAESVIEIIKQGCDDIGAAGYDTYTGYGRVNFLKTLELARHFRQPTR